VQFWRTKSFPDNLASLEVYAVENCTHSRRNNRLAIELNPVGEDGSPKKRRGLVLRSQAELDEYRELFQYDKLAKLMEMLEAVNPKAEEAAKRRRGEEVIEL